MITFSRSKEFESLLTPYELNRPGRESSLSLFLNSIAKGQDVYVSAVAAVAIALGWKWVGISRYIPDFESVDVLAWWQEGELRNSFSYNLAGTPCEIVLRDEHKEYVSLLDVQPKFPKDSMLSELGVNCYAGYTYRDREGEVVGHLFAMDDKNYKNTYEAYDVLSPIATCLSHKLFEATG